MARANQKGKGHRNVRRIPQNAVAWRVDRAFRDLQERDYNGAVDSACPAIASTTRKEGKGGPGSDEVAFTTYLTDHWEVFFLGMSRGGGLITGGINLNASKIDIKSDKEGMVSFQELVYRALRCPLVHESALCEGVVIAPQGSPDESRLKFGPEISIPWTVTIGLILAAMASKTNAYEHCRKRWQINGKSLDDLWGDEESILSLLRMESKANAAPSPA
jgi:hypothetical protein